MGYRVTLLLKPRAWTQPSSSSRGSSAIGIEEVPAAVALQNKLISTDRNEHIQHSLRLGVDISHHGVECVAPLRLDMAERVDITQIHIKVCVGREIHDLLNTGTPLIYGSIELLITVG